MSIHPQNYEQGLLVILFVIFFKGSQVLTIKSTTPVTATSITTKFTSTVSTTSKVNSQASSNVSSSTATSVRVNGSCTTADSDRETAATADKAQTTGTQPITHKGNA